MASFAERHPDLVDGGWYEPLVWNPDVPEVFSAREFPARIAEVLAACPQGHVLLGTDCGEPPCYAFIANGASKQGWMGSTCPAFVDAFGSSGTSTLSLTVPCPQGDLWLTALAPAKAVGPSMQPDLADDYQLAMDRKVPRLRGILTPDHLSELCARYFEITGGSP